MPILDRPIGFYWTEGKAGHGLSDDAVPTLKAGSSIGIPSPPAVLFPDGQVCTPTIETAERLQGFPPGWTKASSSRARWKLIGNAVSPPVIAWIASKFADPVKNNYPTFSFSATSPLPLAGFGSPKDGRKMVNISESPESPQIGRLSGANGYSWSPLSVRALSGFYNRAINSKLRYPPGFLDRIQTALLSRR